MPFLIDIENRAESLEISLDGAMRTKRGMNIHPWENMENERVLYYSKVENIQWVMKF